MLTNLGLADLRLTTAEQRSTGQNLPPDLYLPIHGNKEKIFLRSFHTNESSEKREALFST
jgi:hypothetical protein